MPLVQEQFSYFSAI